MNAICAKKYGTEDVASKKDYHVKGPLQTNGVANNVPGQPKLQPTHKPLAGTPQNKTKGQARTTPRPMGECVQHNNEMQKDANKQQTHGMYAHNNSTTNACSYSSTSSCDEQGAEQMQFVQQVS